MFVVRTERVRGSYLEQTTISMKIKICLLSKFVLITKEECLPTLDIFTLSKGNRFETNINPSNSNRGYNINDTSDKRQSPKTSNKTRITVISAD